MLHNNSEYNLLHHEAEYFHCIDDKCIQEMQINHPVLGIYTMSTK